MKDNRFFRILAIAAIFSLLMLVIPATPALATEELGITPERAEIGDYVSIEGTGFAQGTVVYIYFSSQEAEVGDEIDDEVTNYEKVKTAVVQGTKDPDPGTFEYVDAFAIPSVLTNETSKVSDDEDVHGGDYYIYTTYSGDKVIEASATFTVIGIKELNPDEGPVGTEVEITGVGYDAHEDITAFYDGVEKTIVDGDEDADSGGEFDNTTIVVPESTAGAHTITVVGYESAYEGEATFTVEPDMTLSSTAGAIASQITASGTGFGSNVGITITFGDDYVPIEEGSDDRTNSCGSFEAVFAVPELEPGTYAVVVDDGNNEVEAEFTITTDLTVVPLYTAVSPGYVGAQVEISGVGFKPNSTITITYTSEPVVFTTESLADGSFSYLLIIPPSEAGVHIITATDGIIPTPRQVTFYMESMPPPTPQPKQPMDEKLGGGKFEWYAVVDLSLPVTYDLQIATNASFTDILVAHTGLANAEYTLLEEEELESTSDEEPYYWRVRAVDAASNAGNWSSATSFTVGFSFSGLPGWLLWTLIGIGAVVLFVFGFWLGRRTSYDYY